MDELWFADGLDFTCLECGRCCRGEPGAIWVTPEEMQRLARHVELTEAEFSRRFMTKRWGRPSLVERKNGDCIFLDAEKCRCLAYGLRPAQCSLFPFWPSLLRSRESWEEARERCPGMGQGRHFSQEEILAMLAKSPFFEL